MGDPGLGVVVKAPAVVNGAQMPRGVQGLHQAEAVVPVLGALGGHQVVFVGKGPPYVPEGRQPGHRVTQIIQIRFMAHLGKAPAVVGMEQNQVRLDAHVRQLANALFQPPPGFRIEPGEVEGVALAGSAPFKGIAFRVVVVEFVMLGENAHADFVEISLFQGVQGGLLQCLRLMGPAIAGGAHAHVIFPVGVFQPGGGHVGVHFAGVRAGDPHRAVHPCPGSDAFKFAGFPVQIGAAAAGDEGPAALPVGHETHHIAPLAVVKALHRHLPHAAPEGCAKGNLRKGIPLPGPGKDLLKNIPFRRRHICFSPFPYFAVHGLVFIIS